MGPLSPLAAFQGLAIALAVALMIDARKEPTPWRYIWFGVAAFLAFAGLFANWIGQQWPASYTAMQSLGGDPTAWFVAIVGLYFVARPHWKAGDPSIEPKENSEVASISAEITELEKRLSASNIALGSKIENVRVGNEANHREIRLLSAKISKYGSETATSLWTIRARELADGFAKTVSNDASDLYDRLKSGVTYDTEAWNKWESVQSHWEQALGNWIDLCRFYSPEDLEKRIFTVHEHEYNAAWTVNDNQFPGTDAVRRFKRHRIIQSHWEQVKDKIMANVCMVAYQSMNIEDTQRGALPRQS